MRAAYLGAVRRFDSALKAFDDSGTPMDPGPFGTEPHPWTRQQVEILLELQTALAQVIEDRRTWDAFRREGALPNH